MRSGSRCFVACALCVGLTWAGVAHADDPPPPSPPPAETAPQAPSPSETPAPSKSGAALDFDLFGDQKPKPPGVNLGPQVTPGGRDPLVIERQVKRRRRMLQLHQGFGLATLVLLAATCVIGQLNYIDKYGGGDFTEKYQYPHLGLAMAATASFAATGLLGLTAPTPYKKPLKADAALLHKVMMGIATAGMATQLALGFATAYKGGELYQRDMALGHLVTGYVTFAAMATGYLAFVF